MLFYDHQFQTEVYNFLKFLVTSYSNHQITFYVFFIQFFMLCYVPLPPKPPLPDKYLVYFL